MILNITIQVDLDTTDTDIEDIRSEIIESTIELLTFNPELALIEPVE